MDKSHRASVRLEPRDEKLAGFVDCYWQELDFFEASSLVLVEVFGLEQVEVFGLALVEVS
jgi:hypothetical protein